VGDNGGHITSLEGHHAQRQVSLCGLDGITCAVIRDGHRVNIRYGGIYRIEKI
jgi:hypothetical protein